MAWTTPKTNWQSGDYCTYVDINRIWGNIAYLYNAIGVTQLHPSLTPNLTVSSTLSLDDYNFTQEEVFYLYDLLGGLSDYTFIFNKSINSAPWGSADLNTLESLLLECKDIVDSGNYTLNYVYAGAGTYCSDNDLL